jgi:hypothetical protein
MVGVLIAGIGGFIIVSRWETRRGQRRRIIDLLAYILVVAGIALFVVGIFSRRSSSSGDERFAISVEYQVLSFSSGLSVKTWEVVLALALAFALILWLVLHQMGSSAPRHSQPLVDPTSDR